MTDRTTALTLTDLGWSAPFADAFAPHAAEGLVAGRVALEHKRSYRVLTEQGELLCGITGRLRHHAGGRGDFPAVGDWVALAPRPDEGAGTIHALLPRRSKFSRKAAGDRMEEQIVAANVDTLFLMMALNNDFNIKRLERYLVLAWNGGAQPVVLLSKTDLVDDPEPQRAEVEAVAAGAPVHLLSVRTGLGVEAVESYLRPGQTVALLGSSGVGKSTLANRLVGAEHFATRAVRDGDDRGMHTTTHRELLRLPSGALLIDTPGMRELHLWGGPELLSQGYGDVEELETRCRFSDCQHRTEPGCAVRAALADGSLSAERWENYQKLQREVAFESRRDDPGLQAAERQRWKSIHKSMKSHPKMKR